MLSDIAPARRRVSQSIYLRHLNLLTLMRQFYPPLIFKHSVFLPSYTLNSYINIMPQFLRKRDWELTQHMTLSEKNATKGISIRKYIKNLHDGEHTQLFINELFIFVAQ
jgi:hypothetical protein